MRQYRTMLGEGSQEGAYGYEYRVCVWRTRRGNYYAEVSGFAWSGNEGGRITIRHRLPDEAAASRVVKMIERATSDDSDSMVTLTYAGDLAAELAGAYDES